MADIKEIYEKSGVVHDDELCDVCDTKGANRVLKHSYLHRLLRGHWKEQLYLYYDRYGFDYYSSECVVCNKVCRRFYLGYDCKGDRCDHD